MGMFSKVEKSIESAVSNVFARAFKGDVQPVEIAAAIQRELDAEAKLLSRGKKLVPNDFTVYLSEHDYARLVPYAKTLNGEIEPELRNHAADRGYVFNGGICIRYEEDTTLPTGRLKLESQAVAGVDAPKVSQSAFRSQLVLEVNGVRHPLTSDLVIGRGPKADLRINDPSISRTHVRINVTPNGLTIEDLESTNGMKINGVRTKHSAITHGTRIEIGATRMLVHAPAGTS